MSIQYGRLNDVAGNAAGHSAAVSVVSHAHCAFCNIPNKLDPGTDCSNWNWNVIDNHCVTT